MPGEKIGAEGISVGFNCKDFENRKDFGGGMLYKYMSPV